MIDSRFDRNSNPHDMQHEMRSRNKRKSDAEHNISNLSCSRIIQSTGRKDRHSKVSTVKGPKDRRLRLSPKTAIQFYDLQDRLGFDRPSEAIEWLMREAKDAIDALKSRDDGHQRHNNTPEVASSSFDFDQHLDDQNCEQTYGQENHPGSDFSFFVDEDHVSSSYIDQRGTMMFSEFDANWDCCNEVGIPSLGHEDQMFPRREQFHSVDTETYCQDTVDVSNESTNVDGCSTQGHLIGNC